MEFENGKQYYIACVEDLISLVVFEETKENKYIFKIKYNEKCIRTIEIEDKELVFDNIRDCMKFIKERNENDRFKEFIKYAKKELEWYNRR